MLLITSHYRHGRNVLVNSVYMMCENFRRLSLWKISLHFICRTIININRNITEKKSGIFQYFLGFSFTWQLKIFHAILSAFSGRFNHIFFDKSNTFKERVRFTDVQFIRYNIITFQIVHLNFLTKAWMKKMIHSPTNLKEKLINCYYKIRKELIK